MVVGERGAGGEAGFVHGQPVTQDVDVPVAERPVGVERLDLLAPDLAAGMAGAERRDEPAERWSPVVRTKPTRSTPVMSPDASAVSASTRSRAASAGTSLPRNSSPADVSPTRRLVLSNSLTPRRDSRTRTASLTPGW